jgi:hypothetical protein
VELLEIHFGGPVALTSFFALSAKFPFCLYRFLGSGTWRSRSISPGSASRSGFFLLDEKALATLNRNVELSLFNLAASSQGKQFSLESDRRGLCKSWPAHPDVANGFLSLRARLPGRQTASLSMCRINSLTYWNSSASTAPNR